MVGTHLWNRARNEGEPRLRGPVFVPSHPFSPTGGVIHLLAFFLYLGALGLWIRLLVNGSRAGGTLLASGVAGAAVVVHAFALGEFWVRYGELPLVGPGAALSSLAFVGGLALLVTFPLREISRLGIALLPFIVICLGVALLAGIEPSPRTIDFQGAGFVLHVAFAFLGYQGLAVAFAAGSLYLIQHHELKAKRLGRFFHFIPPLATLDRVGRVGLWVGFGCLTVALAFGWAWTVQHRGSLEVGDPKVIWAVLSWLVFVGILLSRVGKGSTEHRGALTAVIGFGVVIASYVVLRLTAEGTGLFL
jgi:HemX protein